MSNNGVSSDNDQITKVEIVKFLLGWVAGASAAFVTKQIITANVDPDGRREEFQAWLGAAAIGMIVRDATQSAIDTRVDTVVEGWRKFMTGYEKEKSEQIERKYGKESAN